jgi:hypothetical protein
MATIGNHTLSLKAGLSETISIRRIERQARFSAIAPPLFQG